jgi:hypothetical protein
LENHNFIEITKGSNLSFKVPSMPYFTHEFSKALNKRRLTMLIVFRDKEEIP